MPRPARTISLRTGLSCLGVAGQPPSSAVRECPPSTDFGSHIGTQRARSLHEAIWMQTTGAALVAAKQCSLACVLMPAQDSRSAHGLLYPAAVRDDSCQQERCQVWIDIELTPAADAGLQPAHGAGGILGCPRQELSGSLIAQGTTRRRSEAADARLAHQMHGTSHCPRSALICGYRIVDHDLPLEHAVTMSVAIIHLVAICRQDPLLRRSFHAGGQPAHAQVEGHSRYPWVTVGDRSFPPVLARIWHDGSWPGSCLLDASFRCPCCTCRICAGCN
jgi:hypothetical protein